MVTRTGSRRLAATARVQPDGDSPEGRTRQSEAIPFSPNEEHVSTQADATNALIHAEKAEYIRESERRRTRMHHAQPTWPAGMPTATGMAQPRMPPFRSFPQAMQAIQYPQKRHCDDYGSDEPLLQPLPTVYADVPRSSVSDAGTTVSTASRIQPTTDQLINDFVILITALFECDPALRSDFEKTVPNLCAGSTGVAMTLEELIIFNVTQEGARYPQRSPELRAYWKVVQDMQTAVAKHREQASLPARGFLGQLRVQLREVFKIESEAPREQPGKAATAKSAAVALADVSDLPKAMEQVAAHQSQQKALARSPLGHLEQNVLVVPPIITNQLLPITGMTRIFIEKNLTPLSGKVDLYDICVPTSAILAPLKLICLLNEVIINDTKKSPEGLSPERLFEGPCMPTDWGAWVDGKQLTEWTLLKWAALINSRAILFVKTQQVLQSDDLGGQLPGHLPWKQPVLETNAIVRVCQWHQRKPNEYWLHTADVRRSQYQSDGRLVGSISWPARLVQGSVAHLVASSLSSTDRQRVNIVQPQQATTASVDNTSTTLLNAAHQSCTAKVASLGSPPVTASLSEQSDITGIHTPELERARERVAVIAEHIKPKMRSGYGLRLRDHNQTLLDERAGQGTPTEDGEELLQNLSVATQNPMSDGLSPSPIVLGRSLYAPLTRTQSTPAEQLIESFQATRELQTFLRDNGLEYMIGQSFTPAAQVQSVAWVLPTTRLIVSEQPLYYLLKLVGDKHCEPVVSPTGELMPPHTTGGLVYLANKLGYRLACGVLHRSLGVSESDDGSLLPPDVVAATMDWSEVPAGSLQLLSDLSNGSYVPDRQELADLLAKHRALLSAFNGEYAKATGDAVKLTSAIKALRANADATAVWLQDDKEDAVADLQYGFEQTIAKLSMIIKEHSERAWRTLEPIKKIDQIIDLLRQGLGPEATPTASVAPTVPSQKTTRRVTISDASDVASPTVTMRPRFEDRLDSACPNRESVGSEGAAEKCDSNFSSQYSVYDPDKPPFGIRRPTGDATHMLGTRSHTTDTTAEDVLKVEDMLNQVLRSVREIGMSTQASFVAPHATLATHSSRLDKLEESLAGGPSKRLSASAVRATPTGPYLVHDGLYSTPFTQHVDRDGRFVRPLAGAALEANRDTMIPSVIERIELGSGIDTPGRPGSKLPGNPTRSQLAPVPTGTHTSVKGIPTSDLNLAYLLVVSHTVLLPSGEQFQLDQQLIGDQWLPLCTGRTRSPMLGKALMQFGIRVDDRPFDPTIVQRDALIQRARNLFYVPIATGMEETRATIPEFQHLPDDATESARDLLTLDVSHPEAWPKDWVVMNPPDYFVLVRLHAGFDRSMYSQLMEIFTMTALRQHLSLVRHTIAHVMQSLGVHVSAITSSISARRVLSFVDSRYEASEAEYVPLNQLVQLATRPPSLYDTDIYSGRPVSLPPGDARYARDTTRTEASEDSARQYSRTPELKSALCVQLTRIEPAQLKTWSKGSIQYYHLRYIHAFMHGVMKCMIPMMLDHGIVHAYEALKTLVIDRIGERFPHFIDVYTSPNFVLLLSDTIAKQAVDVQAVTTATESTSVQGQQQRAAQFVQGLCRIFLVIRSIPYSTTLDEMARSEMKRLQAIKRPEGITDPQWWTDVARRFRSWLALEGRETMAQAGSEIRDFLHSMLTQVVDRHMQNEIVRLANTWVAGLPAHFNKPSLYALLQYELAPTTRAPVYPTIDGLQPQAPTLAVFEKSEDLRQIHDMGEALRKQGYATSGPALTHLVLDYTVKYVGEHGAAAAMTGQPHDSHVLMMQSEPMGPDGVLDAIVLVNDVLYANEAWPDIRSGIPDVHPPTHRGMHHGASKNAPKVLFSDEHAPQPTPPAPLLAPAPPAPPIGDSDIKRLEKLIDATHTNLNTGKSRNGTWYIDKPAIRYGELSEQAKTHLASAIGIQSETDWLAKSNVVCPLCTEKNHLLNRCLSIWCCTSQGIKFFDADKAAQRFCKARSEKRATPINLIDIFAVYEAACEECDPDGQDNVYEGFRMLLDESQILRMICDRIIDNYDQIFAVNEFDNARDTFLSKCGHLHLHLHTQKQ